MIVDTDEFLTIMSLHMYTFLLLHSGQGCTKYVNIERGAKEGGKVAYIPKCLPFGSSLQF